MDIMNNEANICVPKVQSDLLEQYFKFYMRLVLLATIYFILEWCRRRKSLYLFDGVSLVLYATFLQKTGKHGGTF